jgi:hypothetical protein
MEILSSIPFTLDADRIMTEARVEAGSEDAADLLALIEGARNIGRPKAAYAVSFVTAREGDQVRIDEVSFQSRVLAHHLKDVERVFPHVATCGSEMDREFSASGDLVKEFWWDLIKSRLLGAAHEYLNDHLHRKFRLGKTTVMRPGSGDASVWPIEQQTGLFALLGNVKRDIGVELMASSLMAPNKTISGILFPTETDFRSCEVCHRESCASRQAAFNQVLWDTLQHE